MSPGYDWQSEEEHPWDGSPLSGQELPASSESRARVRILMAAGIVVIAALAAARLLGGYVDRTESSVETEVLTGHNLVMQAYRDRDPDILASFLSGREAKWTQDQLALLDQSVLFDIAAFQLAWQPERLAAEPAVELSADLNQAVVMEELNYDLADGSGAGESIVLRRPMVYRRSQDRWLLSPPLASFWGSDRSSEGRYVSVVYPERDAILANRLAADLESAIASACSRLADLACPPEMHLVVSLTRDPGVLLQMADPAYRLEPDPEIRLPAPSLVGTPLDESGYLLLLRGYSRQVISRLLAGMSGWPCCQGAIYFQALVDHQLSSLGLQSWPLQPNDYRIGLIGGTWLSYLDEQWHSTMLPQSLDDPGGWHLAYSLVEYLLGQDGSPSAAALQRAMVRADSLDEWVVQASALGERLEMVEPGWKSYLRDKTNAS